LVTIRDYLDHANLATTSRYLATNLRMKRDALQTFWNHAGIEPDPAKLGNPSQISWRSCSRFDFRFFILSLFG
jgi:hypothetical protein